MITTNDLPEITKVGLKGVKKMAKKQAAPTYSPGRVAQVKKAAAITGQKPSDFLGSVASDSEKRTALGKPIPASVAGSKAHIAAGQSALNTATGSTIPNGGNSGDDIMGVGSKLQKKNVNDPQFHRFVEKVAKK